MSKSKDPQEFLTSTKIQMPTYMNIPIPFPRNQTTKQVQNQSNEDTIDEIAKMIVDKKTKNFGWNKIGFILILLILMFVAGFFTATKTVLKATKIERSDLEIKRQEMFYELEVKDNKNLETFVHYQRNYETEEACLDLCLLVTSSYPSCHFYAADQIEDGTFNCFFGDFREQNSNDFQFLEPNVQYEFSLRTSKKVQIKKNAYGKFLIISNVGPLLSHVKI